MASEAALHPLSPFHPACVFGDQDIQECQDAVYYLTSRLRAILLDRLDGGKPDQILQTWNAYFALELQLAAAQVGWATTIGVTLDIPYLFRSICSQSKYWKISSSLAVTPEMRTLLVAELDTSLSSYLATAEEYCSQWWNPPPGAIPGVLSPEELRVAMGYHLAILGHSRASPNVSNGPFLSQDCFSTNDNVPPTNNTGRPTTCKRCMPYRKLLEEASVALMETTNHLNAVYQFVQFSSASADRRAAALRKLGGEAIRLKRALENDDVDILVESDEPQQEPGTIGSDYESALPSGIDWNKVTSDRRLSVSGIQDVTFPTGIPSQRATFAPPNVTAVETAEHDLDSGHPPTIDDIKCLPVVGSIPDIHSWRTGVVAGPPEGQQPPPVRKLSAPPKLSPNALGSIFVAPRLAPAAHQRDEVPNAHVLLAGSRNQLPPADIPHRVLAADVRPTTPPYSGQPSAPHGDLVVAPLYVAPADHDMSCARRSPTLVSMDGLEDDDEEPPVVERQALFRQSINTSQSQAQSS